MTPAGLAGGPPVTAHEVSTAAEAPSRNAAPTSRPDIRATFEQRAQSTN